MKRSLRQFPVALSLILIAQIASAQIKPLNICTLFTAKEVTALLATDVEAGESAAMGTGCQWFGKDEQSYAIAQIVGPDFWSDPQQAPGYEPISNLGKKAYSHPDLEGGWRAMALTEDAAASVLMIGKTATRASVVAFIRQLLERQQKGK